MADDRQERKHESVVERYYTQKFALDADGKGGHDLCVLIHSNRICIITVAKSHPLIKDERQIESVSFEVEKGINRLENKVSGKGKRGAQTLSPSSPLCHIKCKDGEVFTICSGIKAQLIEVNENLISNPSLVTSKNSYLPPVQGRCELCLFAGVFHGISMFVSMGCLALMGAEEGKLDGYVIGVKGAIQLKIQSNEPQSEGYIAIVLPKLKEHAQVTKKLSTMEEYKRKRLPKTSI